MQPFRLLSTKLSSVTYDCPCGHTVFQNPFENFKDLSAGDLCLWAHDLLMTTFKVFLPIAGIIPPWLIAKPLYLQEETVQRPQEFSHIKDQMLGLMCKALQFSPAYCCSLLPHP